MVYTSLALSFPAVFRITMSIEKIENLPLTSGPKLEGIDSIPHDSEAAAKILHLSHYRTLN
jgi:hypothetical protein